MKVTLQGESDPQPTAVHSPPLQTPAPQDWAEAEREPATATPLPAPPHGNHRPIGTLMVIAVVLLSIFGMWMLVLGIQQGRA